MFYSRTYLLKPPEADRILLKMTYTDIVILTVA